MAAFAAILTVAKQEIGQAVSSRVHVVVACAVAALAAAGLAVTALVSLHRYVSIAAGPFHADGVVALVFFVIVLGASIYARAESRRVRAPSEIRDRIMLAAPVAARLASTRPKLALASLAIAVLAGVLTGRSVGKDKE